VAGPSGARRISLADYHRLPGNRPEIDTTLGPVGIHRELMTAAAM
jgi:xanthine dehydrogenase YagS FAD-binding subunit